MYKRQGWVHRAAIIEALVLPDFGLRKRGGLIDRNDRRASGRIGFLSDVNRFGCELHCSLVILTLRRGASRLAQDCASRRDVYKRQGYDPAGSRRYAALYVLHGYTGDVAAMVSSRPWETNVVQWADRLIASKRMPPVVLVVVDGFTRLGGSQYVDSIHNGAYATYTVRDIVGHVDHNYRTCLLYTSRCV